MVFVKLCLQVWWLACDYLSDDLTICLGLFSNTFAETFGTQSHCIEHGMAQPWTVNGRAPLFASGGSGCYEVKSCQCNCFRFSFGLQLMDVGVEVCLLL